MKLTFKQRLRRWLMTDEDDSDSYPVPDRSPDYSSVSDDNSINFKVIPASGGRIVQVQYYNEKQDRHCHKLHLVTPDEDLATALAHILQLETLSR